MIESIRAAGPAGIDQSFIPALFALAAPILNWQREAEAVVTLVSTEPYTDQTRLDLQAFAARHGV